MRSHPDGIAAVPGVWLRLLPPDIQIPAIRFRRLDNLSTDFDAMTRIEDAQAPAIDSADNRQRFSPA